MTRRYSPQGGDLLSKLYFYGWTVTDAGCWEWDGNRMPKGYGKFGYEGKNVLAHRAAYAVWNGDLLDAEQVRHTCDNPPCINPEHLLKGDNTDNSHDAFKRGRAHRASLDANKVNDIRKLYAEKRNTQNEIANMFGVTQATVSKLVRKQTWRFVDAS